MGEHFSSLGEGFKEQMTLELRFKGGIKMYKRASAERQFQVRNSACKDSEEVLDHPK